MDVRIPLPSSMAVTNVLGVLGLVAIVVAVAMLAGAGWAVGTGGVFAVAVSVLAQTAAARGAAVVDLDKHRASRAA